jgi:uncharacterized protein YndB with AHSA1/START domain
MNDRNVPLRLDLTFELPGTPEEVWHAIATTDGISSWFMPTDLEEREGGTLRFHMGEDSSPGTVTGWDPPRRFAYVEPDWATLAGQDPDSVTPLATEFLIQAQSGGTCSVRVVSSAFGTGADWEREFFDDMEQGWTPFFEHLRLYLTHFAGRRAVTFQAAADLPGEATEVLSAMRRALGVEREGQLVPVQGRPAVVERIGTQNLLLRFTDGVAGYLALFAYRTGEGEVGAQVSGYYFADAAESLIGRDKPAWQKWLRGLAIPAS